MIPKYQALSWTVLFTCAYDSTGGYLYCTRYMYYMIVGQTVRNVGRSSTGQNHLRLSLQLCVHTPLILGNFWSLDSTFGNSLPSQDSDYSQGRCVSYSSAGSSKIKIRTSLRHKANLALCRNEVRILIFYDPAELEERKCPQFRSRLNLTVRDNLSNSC